MPTRGTLVIVLNYRGEDVLLPCLASIQAQLSNGDAILVVDNGQESMLMEKVHRSYPDIEIIVTTQNKGFAGGMNIGLQVAMDRDYQFAWMVNNDAVILPGALDTLKQTANDTKSDLPVAFSPVITTPQGKVWFAGGRIQWHSMRTRHIQSVVEQSRPYTTEFLTGCALFLPTSTLRYCGLLDERYFLYYEDADLSYRITQLGGSLWVVPLAKVLHHEASEANPTKVYWLVRSGAEFFLRRATGVRRWWIELYFWARRVKNWLERRFFPSRLASEVAKAYTEVSL